jgi:FKBP-type peptidyl-prolyl cis-trans isomerase FkpA
MIAILAALLAAQVAEPVRPELTAEQLNRQLGYLYALSPADGWRQTASGLRFRRVAGDGSGAHPRVTDTVTIHYAGRFIDGAEFDSSIARGEPATFPLGRLIRGWQEGVPLMGVGDRYEFAIPYHLAYGPAGRGPIPGGATLVFTIELIAIAPAG